MVGRYREVFRTPTEDGVLTLARPEAASTGPQWTTKPRRSARMIVIGLGTGRSGTASLAKLLSSQRDAMCFHEMNPGCVRFTGTTQPILNTIDEFQAIINNGDPSLLTVELSQRGFGGGLR